MFKCNAEFKLSKHQQLIRTQFVQTLEFIFTTKLKQNSSTVLPVSNYLVSWTTRIVYDFNYFTISFFLPVIRAPTVKKLLGVPIIPVAPVKAAQPAFSFTEALKKYVQAQKRQSLPPANPSNTTSVPTQTAKPTNQNKPAVSSVLSQRIRSLENQVKGRKKGKKR